MAILLSNLLDFFNERIQKIKYKYGHDKKKCEACEIKCSDYECCLEYAKGDLIL